MKTVLLLGSGRVAAPFVRHLLPDHQLLIATLDVDRAGQLVGDHPNGHIERLDVYDEVALDRAVANVDIVTSLLPPELNEAVCRAAIRHRVPTVNTSYVTQELYDLDAEAREQGVLILSETGLDPGIDHLLAIRLKEKVRMDGGEILDYSSCCGGIPAPEANDNPWGYKLSWSPRGLLLASRSEARYLAAGREVVIPGEELFRHYWAYSSVDGRQLEVYPNRNAFPYQHLYDLEQAQGMFRGTLRYPGWCETMQSIVALGLLDDRPREWPDSTTLANVTTDLTHDHRGTPRQQAASFLGLDPGAAVLDRLEWAGLFEPNPLPVAGLSPLDILVHQLEARLGYGDREPDLVVLENAVRWRRPDGTRGTLTQSLIATGEPDGDSAMARTVGLAAAVATELILQGKVPLVGLRVPAHVEMAEPMLDRLAELGVVTVESDATRDLGFFDSEDG